MALFQYKAISAQGVISRGVVESANLAAASEVLNEKDLVVLQLRQTTKTKARISNLSLKFVRQKDIVMFARQLSVMIAATVPIVPALRILSAQTEQPKLKAVCKEMADDVDGGLQISQAFAKHPKYFSRFFVAMIRSGETSGRLDEVLNYLADQMEKDYDLTSRIKGAMVYPAFIVVSLIVVGVVMMIFVIPKMSAMLLESGAQLPIQTKVLIGVSNFMATYWWALGIVVLAALIILRLWIQSKPGRVAWDQVKLRLPIFGMIVQKITIVRMCRSLSTLIRGGVSISTALEITSEVVDNAAFRDILEKTIKEVQDGNSITTVMAQSKIIPHIVAEMMSIGEQSGKIDEILERLSAFYDREVTALVSSLTSLIEPIIMVIMGVGVAFMVMAVMMPMFQLANAIK
ncbi:MAG: type II secretion system F family protein [Candidatus Komeilibacteria bacterium]